MVNGALTIKDWFSMSQSLMVSAPLTIKDWVSMNQSLMVSEICEKGLEISQYLLQ